MKVRSEFIKNNLKQQPDYVDTEENQKQMMTMFKDILHPRDSEQRTENQKLYGLVPKEWKVSPLNPFLQQNPEP